MAKLSRMEKYADLRARLENEENQSETPTEVKEETIETVKENIENIAEDKMTVTEEAVEEIVEEIDEPINTVSVGEEIQIGALLDSLHLSEDTVQEESLVSVDAEVAESLAELAQSQTTVEEREEITEENESVSVQTDDLLMQTLQEVNEYNKSKGLVTAEEITPTILDEIRVETTEPLTEERSVSSEQQDINDTVTMEIESILRSIEEEKEETPVETAPSETDQAYIQEWLGKAITENQEVENLMGGSSEQQEPLESLEIKDETDKVSEEIKEEVKEEIKEEVKEEVHEEVKPEAVKEELPLEELPIEETEEIGLTKSFEAVQEHPVLTKELEAELDEEPTVELDGELLNDTKTYIIDQEEKETLSPAEEVEEEAPNKVLNIILMVLVVALLAILAVTAYGLLKTMNII